MKKSSISVSRSYSYSEQIDQLEASISQSILAAACLTLILILL